MYSTLDDAWNKKPKYKARNKKYNQQNVLQMNDQIDKPYTVQISDPKVIQFIETNGPEALSTLLIQKNEIEGFMNFSKKGTKKSTNKDTNVQQDSDDFEMIVIILLILFVLFN